MSTDDELDLDRLPHVINAVLDLMPNGEMWRARFADDPGASMDRDDDGWLVVMHHGDVVMRISADTLRGDGSGLARVMVDGVEREVELSSDPPDDGGEW